MIKESIEKELKEAMKAKDSVKMSSLRMLKADMHNVFIEKKEELKDADIIKIIHKQVKKHKDSIEQFKKGNREDLAKKEGGELAILETFLPKQLPEKELRKIIEDVIKEIGASTKKDMGRVIKEVMAKAKGQADGKAVSQMVSGLLK